MIDLAFAKAIAGKDGDKEILLFLAELMKTSREGNLFLQHSTIKEKITHLVDGEKSPLVAFEDCFYLRRSWELETQVIQHLRRLSNAPLELHCKPTFHPDLYPAQQEALISALVNPLSIITGGPGCGKTFLATKLIETLLAEQPHLRIIATAPTGKAASRFRMPSVVSGTLHSLLGLRDSFDGDVRTKPLIADLILIDECSMIDLRLWSLLLSAIPTGTHLVLMGDPNQLPPIDAGALFYDMCQIEKLSHVHLDQPMRTGAVELRALAECVKQGDYEKALQHVTLLPLREVPDTEGVLLTPFRHGPFGTHACNHTIEKLKPHQRKPIIITKNDYPLGLMNGDLGYIEGEKAIFFEKSLPLPLLTAYDYAWAISIHKSQGSEWKDVTILLPEGSETFGREMLYTAITRAKSTVTLHTSPATFHAVISHFKYPKSNLQKRFNNFV